MEKAKKLKISACAIAKHFEGLTLLKTKLDFGQGNNSQKEENHQVNEEQKPNNEEKPNSEEEMKEGLGE